MLNEALIERNVPASFVQLIEIKTKVGNTFGYLKNPATIKFDDTKEVRDS